MKRERLYTWQSRAYSLLVLLLLVSLISCNDDETGTEQLHPYQYLSEYGFFQGELKELKPGNEVIPYDLLNPLFSDYAEKDRFVYIPEGMVTYRSHGVFEFPEGAILIKNFSYPMPSGGKQRIETRLLRKTAIGWEADAYLWNQEQTDARLHISGATVDVSFENSKGQLVDIKYLVPDKNQCKTCHSVSNEIELIGPTARNLNFIASNGRNQLELWQEAGILDNLSVISQVPVIASVIDENKGLVKRARAYLDINCGHCHNPNGSANNSGLFLHYDEDDPFHLGYCKIPIAAGPGTGGHKFVISPGSASTSILWYRMNSTLPAVRMPELSRTLVHEEGVELIRQWIDEMEEEDCG